MYPRFSTRPRSIFQTSLLDRLQREENEEEPHQHWLSTVDDLFGDGGLGKM